MISKLGEICTIKYGKDHRRLANGNIPVYGSGGVMRYVDTALYKKKSVLIPRKGSLDKLYFLDKPFWTVDTLFYTEIDETKIVPEFLYFQLSMLNLASMNVGTAVPSLTTAVLNEIEIDVPPLPVQKAIAATLSCLDDMIELNNRTNQILEEIAQAIFKRWFVDFEFPNEDGEPYKSSGGEMVDSELGEIPKGWREGRLEEFGEIVGGSTPSKTHPEYYSEHDIAWITPKDLSNDKSKFISRGAIDITPDGLQNSSAKKMPRGAVLFSSRAPIGYMAIAKNEITTNQGFKSVVPYKNIGTEYVYYSLKENLSLIESRASGSTFKEVSGSVMKQIPIVIPQDDVLSRFRIQCSDIFYKQELLEEENKVLSNIRDTLLPKLMSGEIRVPVEEVV